MSANTSLIDPAIRLLSEADVELFRTLRLQAIKEQPEAFADTYEESVNKPVSEMAQWLKNSHESFVFGAFSADLVGVAGFIRREGVQLRHKGTIWGVYVSPQARGKGLGRALMQAAISHASSIPALEELILAVSVTKEAACCLYQSLGFISYGIERGTVKIGNKYLDKNLMALKLIRNCSGEMNL